MDQNDLTALLATLRQAQDGTPPEPAAPAPAPAAPSQSDLDALLSTLTALPPPPSSSSGPGKPLALTPTPPGAAAPPQTQSRTRDVSHVSFQEAVPLLHSLARDEQWLDRVERVWEEQKNWELRAKDERNRLRGELDRKAVSAGVKATRLKEWDRALMKRWAGLQAQQQEQLQSLGVPTFQKTTDPTLRKRQDRVLAVLVGFLEDRDG
ncbi:hypothetical protein JCM10207_003956 [Rhodosporidiobolus poonsookiae]